MKSKHENERSRQIATDNLIFRCQVGSGLHGVTTGDDDRDEMGLCIEPPSCVIGLEKFEQYQYRTQPEGVRSGKGDLDYVCYSLRKWARLAADGNPTVLLLLFIPDAEVMHSEIDLAASKDLFISRECGKKFLGYLQAQKERMLGLRSQRTNRPELVDVYGFDTKFAYHAIRLGIQGVQLLTEGVITLPMPEPVRSELTALRAGSHTKDQAIAWIEECQTELERLTRTAELPDRPDRNKVDNWLIDTYQNWWESH